MAANALENFARWNLQVALLAIVAAVLVRLLRMARSCHAPRLLARRARSSACAAAACSHGVDDADASVSAARWRGRGAYIRGVDGQSVAAGAAIILARAVTRVLEIELAGSRRSTSSSSPAPSCVWSGWRSASFRLRRLRRAGAAGGNDGRLRGDRGADRGGAEIRRVERLGQPVTFGILHRWCSCPNRLPHASRAVQRAVLAHELWHVRRRDWLWVLIEEAIRAAFWFNPAMWWLVSRVQSSREEVVDELTVRSPTPRRLSRSAPRVCRRTDAVSRRRRSRAVATCSTACC